MFSKTADPTSPPTRPTNAAPTNAARSVLSADLRVVGEITSTGTIEVLGEIDGTVSAHGLIVGGEGRVTGSVAADTVEVKGRLEGKVTTGAFTLRAAAQVNADVTYTTVVIESGAQVEGRYSVTKT